MIFQEYFSDRGIIDVLCAQRIKAAKRRHEGVFLEQIFPGSGGHTGTHATGAFLPGRLKWKKFRADRASRRLLPSSELDFLALRKATLKLRERDPSLAWNVNLTAKIDHIRSRVFGPNQFVFSPPKLTAIPKKGNVYRLIASFLPDDKVIDCLTARYLNQVFDPIFHQSCLAFRQSSRDGSRDQGIQRILDYREKHHGQALFVAEADIKGCFDCVDHAVVMRGLQDLSRTAGITIDPHALRVLNAFLDAYSFSRDATRLQTKLGRPVDIPWHLQALKEFHDDPLTVPLGVPQGGALSGLIVNVILHRADEAIEKFRTQGNELVYLRFCDDIIILSPSHEVVEQAFNIYLEQLRFLKLPVHPAKVVSKYLGEGRREYWAAKSKAPYLWSMDVETGGIPWIGFLGYQIRRDGMMRIRPESLEKHRRKLIDFADTIVRKLDDTLQQKTASKIRLSAQVIYRKIRARMTAMGVGRANIGGQCSANKQQSFTAAFALINGKVFPAKMLRDLDRFRERNLRRIARRLRMLKLRGKSRKRGARMPRYLGRPFSYAAQLARSAVASALRVNRH